MRDRGSTFFVASCLVASVCLYVSGPAWAKHHKQPAATGSVDPCAAPQAYVRDHISQIKALQATAQGPSTPLFDMFSGQKPVDVQKSAKISELRYDADGVNALLRAGGCKAFDLDHELPNTTK